MIEALYYFAAHAPEVPDWFVHTFEKPHPTPPNNPMEVTRYESRQWISWINGPTPREVSDLPTIFHEWGEAFVKYEADVAKWKQEKEMSRLVAWRWAFARAMTNVDK